MKTFLPWMCIGVVAVGLLQSPAQAQDLMRPGQGAFSGMNGIGNGPISTNLSTAWPGRVWVGANLADNGLGYNGSYFTLGSKTRLFEDGLDGRWLLEGRGHIAADTGNFFSNVGIERVFTLDAAGADVTFGAWFDYDDDQNGHFAHTYKQLGLSGAIKTKFYDIYGNGYLPSGDTTHTLGDPTGQSVFLNNSIVMQAGIDTALQGFDGGIRARPAALGFVNGSVELGGYAYQADLVDTFGGVRGRANMQFLRGMTLGVEVNHDNVFETTGLVSIGWIFGGYGANTEYSAVGRDLESTVRNDHVVRWNQELILAQDPDTASPYVVWHVDNTAAPGGDGSFARPFQSLAQAQAASGPQNVIFVHNGDGTVALNNAGITLKTGQLLLGDGMVHAVPILGGGTFNVFNDVDGLLPRITNDAGNAITLADDNTVRGFILDGSTGNMANGIFGDGGAGTLTDGVIEDVTILGNPILHGINLNFIDGDWRFARNNISTAGFNGINIDNMSGATSTLTFASNNVSNNLNDGIHIEDFDGRGATFTNNTTNNNIRDGVRIQRYAGTSGNFLFRNHTASGNVNNGVFLDTVDGDVQFLNSTFTNNSGAAIRMLDVTNATLADDTLIDTVTFTGNGRAIDNELTTGIQRLLITGSTINANTLGILSQASGVGTVLTTEIVDNVTISNQTTDAVRVLVSSGATHNFLLENTGAPLTMANNGNNAGVGVSIFANDGGANTSSMNAIVRNVNMTNTGNGVGSSGIFVSGDGNSVTDFLLQDSTLLNGAGGDSISVQFSTTNALVSTVTMRDINVTQSGGDGINISNTGSGLLDLFINNAQVVQTGAAATPDADAGRVAWDQGLSLTTAGTTMTRLVLTNSNFNGFRREGIAINTADSAELLARIEGTEATNNGPGDDPVAVPFHEGIAINADDTSRISLRFNSNEAHSNAEAGLALTTGGAGRIDATLAFNSITNNDLNNDTSADPPFENGNNDALFVNSVLGTMNVALSNNFFALPAFLVNGGAPGAFTVELDGTTNLVAPTLVGGAGNFTVVPYGTVIEPNITAREAVFSGAGFP